MPGNNNDLLCGNQFAKPRHFALPPLFRAETGTMTRSRRRSTARRHTLPHTLWKDNFSSQDHPPKGKNLHFLKGGKTKTTPFQPLQLNPKPHIHQMKHHYNYIQFVFFSEKSCKEMVLTICCSWYPQGSGCSRVSQQCEMLQIIALWTGTFDASSAQTLTSSCVTRNSSCENGFLDEILYFLKKLGSFSWFFWKTSVKFLIEKWSWKLNNYTKKKLWSFFAPTSLNFRFPKVLQNHWISCSPPVIQSRPLLLVSVATCDFPPATCRGTFLRFFNATKWEKQQIFNWQRLIFWRNTRSH